MNIKNAIILLSLATSVITIAQTGVNAQANKPAQHKLKNRAYTVTHKQQTFDVYIVNYTGSNIQLCWKDDNGNKLISLNNLKKHIEQKGKKLLFATNAGIYLEDNSPKDYMLRAAIRFAH